MDIVEMRSLVRRDLHDEDEANFRWSVDEIDRHINRAVMELSEVIPLAQTVMIATTAGLRDIDISGLADRVTVEAIEYPVGRFPKQYQRFSVWGDTLTILRDEIPDGADCCVYYGKLHTLDENGSSIPRQYEYVVATGAAGYAAVEWAAFVINRVNIGGNNSAADFLTWGKEMLNFFHTKLKDLGRRNRTRVRSLYRPYQPVVSKTVDYGP
jgi:hypothetical protein